MPLWYFFSLFWTPMSTKLWDFSCFLIRNMFCWLVVYFTHLAPHVHFSCFVHALHITTFCTHLCYPCHALVYILFLHPLHVMFTLCFVVFLFLRCFVFVWASFSHSSCTPHASSSWRSDSLKKKQAKVCHIECLKEFGSETISAIA